jgi:YcaO-like protein with predicted kinase domain
MSIEFFDSSFREEKQFKEGTHRTQSPSETISKFLPKKTKMGITRLANITGLDFIGLPVYIAVRPNSRSLANSQGKGLDDVSAMASALMEAAESWHAENLDLPIKFESPAVMRSRYTTIELKSLLRNNNQICPEYVPFKWVQGYDLIKKQPTYVPYATVSLYFIEELTAKRTFHQSSSGLASGNTLLESINHGTYELIERHSIEEHQRLSNEEREARRLNLSSISDLKCLKILQLLERAGVEVVVFDATGSLGVPTYVCRVFDRYDTPRWSLRGICGGYGTHLCPGVALMRSITEAIQSRLSKIAGARDDLFMDIYESKVDKKILKNMYEQFKNSEGTRVFPQYSEDTLYFDEDLNILMEKLKKIGLSSLVVVDLTKTDIGIPVSKTIISGLQDLQRGGHNLAT